MFDEVYYFFLKFINYLITCGREKKRKEKTRERKREDERKEKRFVPFASS
jgi:hypothetical protein